MAQNNQKTLRQRKMELEAELNTIQNELDTSVDRVKADVNSTLDPVEYIKRNPLPVFGASVVVGFLIGRAGGDDDEGSELLSTLWYEIKRMAVRKGIGMVSDHADRFIDKAVE